MLIYCHSQLTLTLLVNTVVLMSSRSYSGLWHFQLMRACCLAVFWWGRKGTEWRVAKFSRWPSLAPSLLFLSHNPLFHPARIVPPVLFPATTQWKHGAVGAEQNTVWFCVSLSLWLIDNVRLLDNSDNTVIAHVSVCVCVCVLCCGKIQVCEHALSHFVRRLILCWISVCVTLLCPLQGGPSLLNAAAQSFYTWTHTRLRSLLKMQLGGKRFHYRQAAGMKNHS